MAVTVYIKPDKNTEVHETEVFLGQVAEVWCRNKTLENKCKAIKVLTIHREREDRYVLSVLRLVEMIQQIEPAAEVTNLGEMDLIIDYQPKVRRIGAVDWVKTIFVCAIVFFGGAFAIMTFNNDGSVAEIFRDVDRLVTGQKDVQKDMPLTGAEVQSDGEAAKGESGSPAKTIGVWTMEISYSIGLFLGVTLFFNHLGKHKVTIDPTPIEVQMRLYEDQVDTTVIQNASRKESGVDPK